MTKLFSLRTSFRFSLTWRVIALSSLLLLVLVTLFTWLGHSNLTRQLQESRSQQHERQQREIRLALQRSSENLRQLAGLTAASTGLGYPFQEGNLNELDDVLDAQWPSLQVEAGIDEIVVVDINGRTLGNWGEHNTATILPIESWIKHVINSESPLTTLRCSTICQQFAAAPILAEGESVGMVVLARSLADVTRQAKEVSNSEIATLVTGSIEGNSIAQARQLDAWNGHLVALTHEELSLALLQRAATIVPVQRLIEEPLSLQHNGRNLELSAVYMGEDTTSSNAGYFLLISDITDQLKAINQDTRTLLVAGVIGWLAAELLLLMILMGPMARLRRVAGLLPRLASGGFSEIRNTIPTNRSALPNEIDVLEITTLALSRQLESLEDEVRERGNQLAERIDELAKERDFVSSLLDTAQVFIVVQDSAGRISLVNDYTQTILGLNEASLLGRHFVDIFASGTLSPTGSFDTHTQEEQALITPDQKSHTVVWYHAPLFANNDTGISRISIGLDITERKAAEARLVWLAERDPLTELYNRRYFQDALQKAIWMQDKGAVLLLDLDQFKEVNELNGHHVGDRLLREVAETLSLNLGHRGVIARLGGDEFSLLLKDMDAEQAVAIAQYIVQLFEGIGFRTEQQWLRVTASIGIAL